MSSKLVTILDASFTISVLVFTFGSLARHDYITVGVGFVVLQLISVEHAIRDLAKAKHEISARTLADALEELDRRHP